MIQYTYEQRCIYISRSARKRKGTITEAFIKKIPPPVAFLEPDAFRWRFHQINRDVYEISDDEHELAYENYLDVLENYLHDGRYTIVTEGLFSWNTEGPHGSMQDILRLAKNYEYEVHPILLYADKDTLWKRNREREYTVPRDEFDGLYEYVMNEQSDEEVKIAVGKLSVSAIMERLNEEMG